MKNIFTFKNIQFTFIATAFAFTMVFVVIPQSTGTLQVAQACCGTDGGGGDVNGGGGSGGGGGGPLVPAPTCNIATNVAIVNSGDQYTISWNGTPANGTFKVNDYPVSAVGQKTYTFTAANYSRFVFTGQTAGGTCVSEVRVNRRVIEAPVCSSFTATPATLPVGGGRVNLVWNTTSATTATLDGQSVAGSGSLGVNVTANKTFTLTLSNSVGQVSCTAPVTVATPTPLPTCDSFTAAPTSIVRGHSSVLTWATTNATAVSINNGVGAVSVDGTYAVTPNNTTAYTLTATLGAKSVTCTKTVTVTDVPTPKSPTCDSFTAAPTSIVRGHSSVLTWATTNATAVSINNGVGAVSVDGTYAVTPNNTTAYTLTATLGAKAVTCTKTVTVTDVPTPKSPTCDSFTASPTIIDRGQSSTLTWNTTNANSASINNAVGTVKVDGSVSVAPIQSTTYTLTAVGTGGTVSCPVIVTVRQPQTSTFTCSNNVNFSANPSSFRRGDSTTLSWSTNGVTSVRFNNGINATGLSGSVSVSPSNSETYVMTVSNGSKTIDCPISVSVSTSGGGGGGTPTPRCTLKISDATISKGDRVTLTWDTTNANDIVLKDNHGKTLVTTEDRLSSDKRDLLDGDITLRPDTDSTYTLVATRGSRDKTCIVKVAVGGGITVIQDRDQQPLVTGIALTQVPYTGFEAGPFLTTLFYALLAMFAAYLAYIFVIRRDGAQVAHATVLTDTVHAPQVFATPTSFVPNFHQAAPVVVSTATIGYAAAVATEVSDIEARAHAEMILLSADALAQLAAATNETNVAAVTAEVFAKAKASYPSEDGYVTIGLERLNTLLA